MLLSLPFGAGYLFSVAALAAMAFTWRRTAFPRSSASVQHGANDPATEKPLLPPAQIDTQTTGSGTGSLIRRRYELRLTLVDRPARELVRLMQGHLSELAPSPLAHFEKRAGVEREFRMGDEFEITMFGPWNGRVRVADVSATSFTFVTLLGHPEAGHITFSARASRGDERTVIVLIESWARARDAIVDAAYGTLGIGKQVQAEVWITFLHRLSALVGIERTPPVRVSTEEWPGGPETSAETPRDA